MTQTDNLLNAVMQGRYDTFCGGSVCKILPGADFKGFNDNCLFVWGMHYALANGIMEKDETRVLKPSEIDETIDYFAAKKLPFMWWSSDKTLETKGFMFGGILTGIAVDISKGLPNALQMAPELKIKIVETEDELKRFTEFAGEVFAMEKEVREEWLIINRALMKNGEQIHFMAYLDDVFVGTGTLSVAATSAGIWNLATSDKHRKKGIGSGLVHAALVEAKKRDKKQVMAILMPKGLAWGLFTNFKFEAVTEFPFYIYGAKAEDLEK